MRYNEIKNLIESEAVPKLPQAQNFEASYKLLKKQSSLYKKSLDSLKADSASTMRGCGLAYDNENSGQVVSIREINFRVYKYSDGVVTVLHFFCDAYAPFSYYEIFSNDDTAFNTVINKMADLKSIVLRKRK